MEHWRAVIKVAFIGAGSVEFTRNVVTDLCSYPELNGRLHFALHDISAERLSWADRLTRRIVAQTGAKAEVSTTLERREALRGAAWVVNEIQVGGYAATRLDFDIPARYGVRQTIWTAAATTCTRPRFSTRTPRPRSLSIRPSPCATTCWRRTGRCCPRRCCAENPRA